MVAFLVHRDFYLMTREINLDQTTVAPVMDGLVNRCIAAASEALRTPTSVFTEFQHGHLGNIFKSMRPTHESIRELLRQENKSPHSVPGTSDRHHPGIMIASTPEPVIGMSRNTDPAWSGFPRAVNFELKWATVCKSFE